MHQVKKRVLVVGGNSYIAQEFFKNYKNDFDMTIVKRDELFSDYFKIDKNLFEGMDVVINFTAIVHKKGIERELYTKINTELALFLASIAKEQQVKQFIQFSTIAVYGDELEYLQDISKERPVTPYGESKLEADNQLLKLENKSFSVSIIRPPMVYGLNAPGNMQMLIKLMGTNLPLPFKNFLNQKSFIYIGNLLNAISLIIKKEVNGIFLVKDEEDLSIGELAILLKQGVKSKNILFPLPNWVLTRYMKKVGVLRKLYGTLIVDDSKTREKIGIYTTFSVENGIAAMLQKGEHL